MKKFIFSVFLFACTVIAFGQKLPFQGKLIESGTPVEGPVTLEFSIADPIWSETHTDVSVTDGLYFVVLGSINPLPDSLFYEVEEQNLNISVDGTPLSPVVLFKPLYTPFGGGTLNVTNSEGNVVGTMEALDLSDSKNGVLKLYGTNELENFVLRGGGTGGNRGVFSLHDEFGEAKTNMFIYGGGGIFTALGKETGAIQGGFKAWEGEESANRPFFTLEGNDVANKSLAWLTVNKNETTEFGELDLYSNDGAESSFTSSEISMKNNEGLEVINIKAGTNQVKYGELKISGEGTGIITGSFYKANDEEITDVPYLSLIKNDTVYSYISTSKYNNRTSGRFYLGAGNGDFANIYPNYFSGRHNGRTLFAIGHADWNGSANFGLLMLDGPNSGNFEITGQHWGNPDLPFFKMKGTASQDAVVLSAEDNEGESGSISLKNKADANQIYREFTLNSTGLKIWERQNWDVLHEAVSLDAQNLDDLGWAGYLALRGANSDNINFGGRYFEGNADLPFMHFIGENNYLGVDVGMSKDGIGQQYGWINIKSESGQNVYLSPEGSTISGGLNVNGDVVVNGVTEHTSDRRFKKNILKVENSLQKIEFIEGVSYDWRQEEFPERNFSSDKQIGLIAQELEAQFPELVKTNKDGYKSVNYNGFTAVLLEAVKELNAKVEKLETENLQLKAELSTVTTSASQISELKEQMKSLSKLVQENRNSNTFQIDTATPGLN